MKQSKSSAPTTDRRLGSPFGWASVLLLVDGWLWPRKLADICTACGVHRWMMALVKLSLGTTTTADDLMTTVGGGGADGGSETETASFIWRNHEIFMRNGEIDRTMALDRGGGIKMRSSRASQFGWMAGGASTQQGKRWHKPTTIQHHKPRRWMLTVVW